MDVAGIPDTPARTVAATETSVRILEALKRLDGAGVTDLSDDLGVAKGTVHKHLNTLRDLDYVVKDGGTYRLSLRFLGLGNAARSHVPLHEVARGPLEKLAETVGETASIMVPEHGYGVYVTRIVPEDAPDPPVTEGERVPLHATAGGKAILAYLPDEEVARILDNRGLPAVTDATITDREELRAEIQRAHDSRMAYDRGEHVADWFCLAAPLLGEDDRAVGALTVSGSADSLGDKLTDSDIVSLMGSIATSVENRLHSR